jgi:hypothetical protein
MQCPACAHFGAYTKTVNEQFEYGYGESYAVLSVEVETIFCDNCEGEYTGYKAEQQREAAVKEYLANK